MSINYNFGKNSTVYICLEKPLSDLVYMCIDENNEVLDQGRFSSQNGIFDVSVFYKAVIESGAKTVFKIGDSIEDKI